MHSLKLSVVVFSALVGLIISIVVADELPTGELKTEKILDQKRLSQISVTALVTDAIGTIWVGTQDGLNRYNGQAVIQLTDDLVDQAYPLGHHIQQLFFENNKDLWVVTSEAVQYFDPITNRFIPLNLPQHLTMDSVHADKHHLLIDHKNNIWMIQNQSLHLLSLQPIATPNLNNSEIDDTKLGNTKLGDRQLLAWSASYPLQSSVLAMQPTPDGIALLSENKLTYFQKDASRHQIRVDGQIELPDKSRCLSNIQAGLMIACGKQSLLIIKNNRLIQQINLKSLGIFEPIRSVFVSRSQNARQNNVYLISASRLTQLRLAFNKTHHLFRPVAINHSKGMSIQSFYENSDGSLLIGTRQSGLHRIKDEIAARQPSTTKDNRLRILKPGTNHSLVMSIAAYPKPQPNTPHSARPSAKSTSQEQWMLAGDGSGVINLIHNEKVLYKFPVAPNLKTPHEILSMVVLKNGDVWTASQNGLTRIKGLDHLLLTPSDPTALEYEVLQPGIHGASPADYPTQLLLTETNGQQTIWVTFLRGGLAKIADKGPGFTYIRPDHWPQNKPFADYIYTLAAKDDTIWLAGYQGKLYAYHPQENQAKVFDLIDAKDQKAKLSQVYSMSQDHHGGLWLGGVGGFGRFDLTQNKFHHFAVAPSKSDFFLWPDQFHPYRTVYSLSATDNSVLVAFGRGLFNIRNIRTSQAFDSRIELIAENLPAEFTTAIFRDDHTLEKATYWLGLTNGIAKVALSTQNANTQVATPYVSEIDLYENGRLRRTLFYLHPGKQSVTLKESQSLMVHISHSELLTDTQFVYRFARSSRSSKEEKKNWHRLNTKTLSIPVSIDDIGAEEIQRQSSEKPVLLLLSELPAQGSQQPMSKTPLLSLQFETSTRLNYQYLFFTVVGLLAFVAVYWNKKSRPNKQKKQSVETTNNQSTGRKHCMPVYSNNKTLVGDYQKAQSGKDAFMEKFIRKIEEHYQNNEITVNDLAGLLYTSSRQLSRRVKSASGYSPMELLRLYRLQKSLVLLKKNYSLNRIAEETGFSSQSYYSTCFKKYYGVSPTQYQQSAQEHTAERDTLFPESL